MSVAIKDFGMQGILVESDVYFTDFTKYQQILSSWNLWFDKLHVIHHTRDIHVISTQFERNDLLNVLYVIELVSEMKTEEFQIIKVVYTF